MSRPFGQKNRAQNLHDPKRSQPLEPFYSVSASWIIPFPSARTRKKPCNSEQS